MTVEDAREISLSNELWVALETKRALDGEDREVTLRDLVRTSLRMNPRWIIVAKFADRSVRFSARFNTGHYGPAPSTPIPLRRLACLEGLILQSGLDVPARAVKEMVSRAIHVVVQMRELPDHSRRLMEIAEVLGLNYDTSAAFPPTSYGRSIGLSSLTTTATVKPTGGSSRRDAILARRSQDDS